MAVRLANWIAIAIGGTGGTLAALLGSASAPPAVPEQSLPLRPVSEITEQAPAATPAVSAEVPPAASAEPNAAPSSAPSALPAAPATSADTAELPTTPDSLLHSEMHCDQGRSESCIIAARSYESGSAGPTDPEKAEKYRRIALTMWISHCDHNSAAACVTLSKLYRAGEGVPQSDRNADALVARARDLCRYTDVPVCHESPVAP
jgi:TPR repeat protein